MKIILYDIGEETLRAHLRPSDKERYFFSAHPMVTPCQGCFSCWFKTPGKCVIHDRHNSFLEQLKVCEEINVISRCVYGGLSPQVKAVMDRSLGILLPFFKNRNGEMHHPTRYDNAFKLRYFFYGNITDDEMAIAKDVALANAVNLEADGYEVFFLQNLEQLEALL
ncbi:MAG: hypothetical protein LBR25_06060 [Erysipelotrichaceae bacterium]|jgi:multimeric flavodoxin WrbA|nr:hypothetical protein [Erysipelotrichaceae bacterium]